MHITQIIPYLSLFSIVNAATAATAAPDIILAVLYNDVNYTGESQPIHHPSGNCVEMNRGLRSELRVIYLVWVQTSRFPNVLPFYSYYPWKDRHPLCSMHFYIGWRGIIA
ncbi:hypothetical protein MY3296_006029, partial [Beauveria thailandica]